MADSREVLIIDDDRQIVQALGVRLRNAGFTVRTAFDGTTGLDAATRGSFNAIVLDIRIPQMDGLTLLTKLRAQEKTRLVPVVMLSANACDQKKALAQGAQYFMPKPYDPKALLAVVESAVQGGGTHCDECGDAE